MVPDLLEMADYIESAVYAVGEGSINYGGSCGTCKSPCKSCGGGCYGCQGSKASKGALASIPERFKESQLILAVEEVNN